MKLFYFIYNILVGIPRLPPYYVWPRAARVTT
jgi:hypothetical protein